MLFVPCIVRMYCIVLYAPFSNLWEHLQQSSTKFNKVQQSSKRQQETYHVTVWDYLLSTTFAWSPLKRAGGKGREQGEEREEKEGSKGAGEELSEEVITNLHKVELRRELVSLTEMWSRFWTNSKWHDYEQLCNPSQCVDWSGGREVVTNDMRNWKWSPELQ